MFFKIVQIFIIILFFSLPSKTKSQNTELSSDFHKQRRAELRKKLPNNSVAVLFSSPIRNRAVIGRVDLKLHGNTVPIIIQGNHRVACLMVLGYEKVLTTTLVGYKSLIDCSDRCHWPAVISNKCDSEYAMKICSKFIG